MRLQESLKEQGVDSLVPGEYILGFYQDNALFLPEHFRIVWVDQANGILAVMAKSSSYQAKEFCQSILFLKSKWQPNTVADWLTIHPDYIVSVGPAVVQAAIPFESTAFTENSEIAVVKALKKSNRDLSEAKISTRQDPSRIS